jgi:hypothetical protein
MLSATHGIWHTDTGFSKSTYKRANIMPLTVTLPFGRRVDNHNLVHLLAVTALWCPPLRVRPTLWCPPLGGAVRRVRPTRLGLVPQAAFLLQEGGGERGLLRCDRFTAFLTATATAAQPGVHFILRLSFSAKQWLRIHEILVRIRIPDQYPWLIDPDPGSDPDPAIFVSDLQDVNKNFSFFF